MDLFLSVQRPVELKEWFSRESCKLTITAVDDRSLFCRSLAKARTSYLYFFAMASLMRHTCSMISSFIFCIPHQFHWRANFRALVPFCRAYTAYYRFLFGIIYVPAVPGKMDVSIYTVFMFHTVEIP